MLQVLGTETESSFLPLEKVQLVLLPIWIGYAACRRHYRLHHRRHRDI